LDLFKPTMERV